MATETFQGGAAQIAFVFDNVAGYQTLAGAFRPDVEVHLLDASQDGLEQIAAILEGRIDVEALHVVGHGSAGALNLGSLTLDSANVGAYSDVLGRIGGALASGGDILLYGCDVAADAVGVQFVDRIAEATGADVAASSDLTGNVLQHGDWVLETQTGPIEATVALTAAGREAFASTLAIGSENFDSLGLIDAGTSTQMIAGAWKFTSVDAVGMAVADSNEYPVYLNIDGTAADRAVILNYNGDFDVTNYTMGSADGSNFQLSSFAIGQISATAGAQSAMVTITAYSDGLQVGASETVNLSASGTYGAISYTMTNDDAGGRAGSMSFNSAYANIDKLNFSFGGDATLSIDDIVAAAPVVADTTAPVFSSAAVNGATLVMTYTDANTLDAVNVPGAGSFTVTAGGSAVTVDAVAVNAAAKTITLTLHSPVAAGQAVTVAYTDPTGGNDAFAIQDAAGNDAASRSAASVTNNTADNIAPNAPSAPVLAAAADTGTSNSDQLTKLTTPTLSGTAEGGATVKLYDGATLVGMGTADGGGAWSITTNTLAEGAHSITATATDAAGNLSAASGGLTVTVDTTAPTVAITSNTSALIVGQTATITFTFSEDPGATFAWDGSSGDVVVSGGTLSAIAGTGTTRTATFTPTANTDFGTASITVAAGTYTDAAGNNGGAGATPSVQFDTKGPTVSITSDKAALRVGETATITFTFSEDPGATFASGDLAVSGGALSAISGTGTTRTAVFTPDASTNAGTASITVTAGAYTDAAGNSGAAGATPSLSFDTLAPNAPSAPVLAAASDTGTSNSDQLTKLATPTFSGTTEAGATVKLYDGATLVGTGTADGGGAWSITTTTLAEGAHSITATATDARGNVSTASAGLTVTVDTTAPTMVVTSDKAALQVGETATITFTFSEAPDSSFDASDVMVSGGTLSAIAGTGFTRTAVFTPDANVNAGTASLTVTAGSYSDAAGNLGGAAAAPSVQFDTLVPTVSITSDKAALQVGETATITFTFSEDPGASFAWDGSSGDVVVSGGTLSAISGTGTARTAVFTPDVGANAGTASITVTAGAYTDAAGNAGLAGSTPALSFDTLAPNAPSLPALEATSDTGASNSDHLTKLATPTLSGTAEAGATVSLYDGATLVGTGTADGAGAWSITTASLAEGTHTIVATATDTGGNVSAAGGALTFRIDATAPAAPSAPDLATASDTGASNTDNITTDTQPTFTGTAEADAVVSLYDTDGTTLLGSTTADALGDWSITSSTLSTGNHTITAKMVDGAGNPSTASSGLTVTIESPAPPEPEPMPTTMVDGVQVETGTITNSDGSQSQVLTIPVVTPGRTEQVGNNSVADIPLVTSGGASLLTVQVPTGFGLQSFGASSPRPAGDSLTDLIREIRSHTAAGSADQQQLTGGGAGFLEGLSANTPLLVQTIVPTVAAGSPPTDPLVISGQPSAPGQPGVALVIDGRSNPNQHIELQNVEFAAVIGSLQVTGGAGSQYVWGDSGSQQIFLGADNDTLHGGGGVDTVGSASGDDHLYGDDGNDSVFGGLDNDVVQGNLGSDFVQGNQGADRVYGGQGDDEARGGKGDDLVSGDLGDDRVFGDYGADRVEGGAGNDTVWGGDALDSDQDGGDTIHGGDGADLIQGERGDDTIYGDAGDDWANGNKGADTLFGGDGSDTVRGGQDRDSVSGDAGNDQIWGDQGDDTLAGGAGADTFVFRSGDGADRILDFSYAQGDRLMLTPGTSYTATQAGADVHIVVAGGGEVVLAGVQLTSLTAGWIIA